MSGDREVAEAILAGLRPSVVSELRSLIAPPAPKPAAEPSASTPHLTPADIARLTGMAYGGVLAEIRSGRLRAAKLGKGYGIEVDWYRAWLASRVVTPVRAVTAAPARRRAPAAAGSLESLREVEREAAA